MINRNIDGVITMPLDEYEFWVELVRVAVRKELEASKP